MNESFDTRRAYKDCYISIQTSLEYVLNGPINNKPALVDKIASHQTGNNKLSELN